MTNLSCSRCRHYQTDTLHTAYRLMKKGSWQRLIKFEDGRFDIANHNQFKAKILGVITKGFTRQNARGVLKVFEDTNNDGVLNRADELIGRARVEKRFRDSGSALQEFENGSVKQKWETSFLEEFPTPMLSPYLEFRNNEGKLVAEVGITMKSLNWSDDFGF